MAKTTLIDTAKFILKFMCLVTILIGIQNCAPFDTAGVLGEGGSGSLSVADTQMADSFSNTLQPVLRVNCAICHGVFQAPLFAVADPMAAYKTIMQFGLVNINVPPSSLLVTKLESGHNGISSSVTASVRDGVQSWVDQMSFDTEAPTVAVNLPEKATSLAGTVIVTATAADNVGVLGVQFFVDGTATGTEDLDAPYSLALDTRKLSNGSHSLTAQARDSADITTRSAKVLIEIKN